MRGGGGVGRNFAARAGSVRKRTRKFAPFKRTTWTSAVCNIVEGRSHRDKSRQIVVDRPLVSALLRFYGVDSTVVRATLVVVDI